MKCPNCNHSGNLMKRPFVRRKGLPDRYCVRCGAQIRIKYYYGRITLLVLAIVLVLVLLHMVLKLMGYPGVSSMMAAGLSGAAMVIFMQRSPFVKLEHIEYKDKKKKK